MNWKKHEVGFDPVSPIGWTLSALPHGCVEKPLGMVHVGQQSQLYFQWTIKRIRIKFYLDNHLNSQLFLSSSGDDLSTQASWSLSKAVISATRQVEVRRIMVHGQSGQKISEIPISTNKWL
jgi:hypothetical protein